MARHVRIQSLDLDHTNTIAERMNTVPGFKTSAAFFTFLRANLVLPPSTLNSTTSTPLLDAHHPPSLPPLYPSSLLTMTSSDELPPAASDPLADIPALTTSPLTSEDDKIQALKLIADSIAQQRQFASRAVIFHPLTIAAYIALLAIVSQFIYKDSSDLGLLATTCAGVTMAVLIVIRGVAGGYLQFAEEMNWAFATNEDGEPDVILGSRFGEEVIGAAILRLEGAGGKKRGKKGKSGGKGVLRAWTVRIRYRGKGVGTELLEEAVRVTRRELGGTAEVGFAAEHANSRVVLPEVFNGGFRRREAKAAKMLEGVVAGMEGKKKW